MRIVEKSNFKGAYNMAIKSEAQKRAVAKYNAANYDTIYLRVPKGQKDIIQSHADETGESMNAFISRAIEETMERGLAPRYNQRCN